MNGRELPIEFEWNDAKDEANQKKHSIGFDEAKDVFEDPQLLIEDSTRPEHGEQRSKAIGRLGHFLIAVIYTRRPGRLRIISARRAKRDERERYRRRAEAG
jgi:uncharacterized DUF497 family protein